MIDQDDEQVEGAAADLDRLSVSGQKPLAGIKTKMAERYSFVLGLIVHVRHDPPIHSISKPASPFRRNTSRLSGRITPPPTNRSSSDPIPPLALLTILVEADHMSCRLRPYHCAPALNGTSVQELQEA
jgi:hypothetical protein